MNLTPFRLFSFLAFIIGFSSCLDDDTTTTSYKDAQIYSFSLTNSKVDGLSTTTFTIDHKNGLIYNADSLAYGTVVSKVVCSLTTKSAASILVMAEATNDTVTWSASDSIDFSKPVKFEVYSQDGTETKTYTATLNVHQHKETGFSWKKIVDKATNRNISMQKTVFLEGLYYTFVKVNNDFMLFISFNDGQTWVSQDLVNFPPDVELMSMLAVQNKLYVATSSGEVYASQNGRQWNQTDIKENSETVKVKNFIDVWNSSCYALIDKDNQYYFGNTSDMTNWEVSTNTIPAGFPVSGFGVSSNKYGLIVVGGKNSQGQLLNTTWLTSGDHTWLQTTDLIHNELEKVEGAALAYYSDKYYLIGGLNTSGTYTEEVFVSRTNGVTWEKTDSLTLTDLYEPRAFSSVHVNQDGLLLFGGTNGITWFDDVWQGVLNELLVSSSD